MDDDDAKPILGAEIATTRDGRDVTRGYVDDRHYLLPQDKVLLYQGQGNYETYEDILRDDRVYSALSQRRSAVVARKTEVVPGGDRRRDRMAADMIRETLKNVRWDAVTERMLYGVFYGYSVAECLWARDGQRVALDAVKVRNRRRFVFDQDFRPRLVTTQSPMGEELPHRKFWCFAAGADNDDEPYGRGLGHHLYWPVWFKKNQLKFWLVFLEKFGQPTTQGKYPRGAKDEEVEKLRQTLRQVHVDSAVMMPEDMEVSLIEAARSGNVDYKAFHEEMQAAITTIILSETMTTDDGSSLSQAQVHMDVRGEIVQADAALVCDSFNRQVATWLTDWNYPGAAVPEVRRVMDDPAKLKALADRDMVIVDMGFRPTKKYVEDTYGIEVDAVMAPTPGAPNAPPPNSARFAEPDGPGDELARAIEAINGEEWLALAEPIIQPILDKAAADPEGLLVDLAEVYPQLNADALMEQLARILFVADVWGRLHAGD